MAVVSSPTTRGRRLAFELRKLREGAGLSPTQAARQLTWSLSKLGRIEQAKTQPSTTDITAALELYGAHAERHAALIQLAKDSWRRGWWTTYGDVFTGSYVALEDEASLIRAWEPQLVPGLLQTPAYAREVISHARFTEPATEIDRRVAARMARQSLLERSDPPQLHAVLDEAVLRRRVGDADIMRQQTSRLWEASQRPNIIIQIVPFDAGAHAGIEGPFVLMSFADDIELDVAYSEGPLGDAYAESTDELGRLRLSFEHVCNSAMSPDASAEYLAALTHK